MYRVKMVLVMTLMVTMMVVVVTGEDPGDAAVKEEEVEAECEDAVDCTLLLPGQALCLELDVDPATQQLRGCQQVDGAARALQRCTAIGNHHCSLSLIAYFILILYVLT